ncbi:PREDICTED: uncharacterized protein LOC108376083 [Rhagoletis zephyria]|uniref:uncharacterized protein LOC108376083 n=1 Tax=Rhagoletis zephyria TaxID=28612 RepID=UPI0008119249|nr:PREDICTED: uncharacterized protein LOC108376083 [Rhagoletis zephyria]
MPSENHKDIEIGNKVENVGASDNVESVSAATPTPANAAPATGTAAPSAVIVVAKESVPADTITNGSSNVKSTTTSAAPPSKESASLSQEQPKQESTAMQANLHPAMQPMQQSVTGKFALAFCVRVYVCMYVHCLLAV